MNMDPARRFRHLILEVSSRATTPHVAIVSRGEASPSARGRETVTERRVARAVQT